MFFSISFPYFCYRLLSNIICPTQTWHLPFPNFWGCGCGGKPSGLSVSESIISSSTWIQTAHISPVQGDLTVDGTGWMSLRFLEIFEIFWFFQIGWTRGWNLSVPVTFARCWIRTFTWRCTWSAKSGLGKVQGDGCSTGCGTASRWMPGSRTSQSFSEVSCGHGPPFPPFGKMWNG